MIATASGRRYPGDRPVDGVDQVVVHLAGPLVVAGGGEGFAEAGRAAVVHLQHRVAAVREPLVVRDCRRQLSRAHGPPCTKSTIGSGRSGRGPFSAAGNVR